MAAAHQTADVAADRALLAALVAQRTVSGADNTAVVRLLADHVAGPGVRVYRDRAADGRRANLLAWKGPPAETMGAGLTLCGHLDVVPADPRGWRTPPFTVSQADGRLVGRGTSDMLGFVAIAANVFRAADDLAAPLALLFTYDEEVGTVGARELVARWADLPEPLPARALVGEPTRLRAVGAHKGHLKLRLLVRGVAAHSGYPHLGTSAVVPAARAIAALDDLDRALRAESWPAGERFPEVPYPCVNVGLVSGGSAINVVPDECVVDFGIRTLPGVDQSALVARIREALDAALGTARWELTDEGDSPPMMIPEDAPWLRAVLARTGQTAAEAVAYATDAGWLQRQGVACVVCGPGDIARAHKNDEYVTPDELAAARKLVTELVAECCRR